ncbi:EspA/EspE family type VII secretion system effector [Mycobacterium sp. LTG2003]
MSLFDAYSDFMGKVGGALETIGPYLGPQGSMLAEAGGSLESLAGAVESIRANGFRAPMDVASDTSEIACVAQSMLPMAKQTLIIAGGLQTLIGLQAQCGWTHPLERGDSYGDSAEQFNLIADDLQKAVPKYSWSGPAADAYEDANTRQMTRARTMPDVDLDMKIAIDAQANAVAATRRILNESATVMGNAILPALALRAFGKYGRWASYTLESSVTASCLTGCVYHVKQLGEASAGFADTIENAARLYQDIANDGYPTWM